jgi:hypothetical protein
VSKLAAASIITGILYLSENSSHLFRLTFFPYTETGITSPVSLKKEVTTQVSTQEVQT